MVIPWNHLLLSFHYENMHEKLPSSSFSRPCNKSFLCIIIIMFFQLQNDYRWSMKNALSFLKLFIPKRAINLWYFASLSIVLDSIFQTYPNARFYAPFFSFYSFEKWCNESKSSTFSIASNSSYSWIYDRRLVS